MPILKSRCFQETHGRKVSRLNGGEEIQGVVLVICAIRLADSCNRTRPHMRRICSGRIVLKRLVVRNVISLSHSSDRGGRRSVTSGRSVRIHDAEVETALKKPPANSSCVQQITDVRSAHLKCLAGCGGANVCSRISVADISEPAISVTD